MHRFVSGRSALAVWLLMLLAPWGSLHAQEEQRTFPDGKSRSIPLAVSPRWSRTMEPPGGALPKVPPPISPPPVTAPPSGGWTTPESRGLPRLLPPVIAVEPKRAGERNHVVVTDSARQEADADRVQQLYEEVAKHLNLGLPTEYESKVIVRLLDAATFRSESGPDKESSGFTQLRFAPSRATVWINTEKQNVEDITRHELAHSLLAYFARGSVPRWIDEGIAMSAEQGGKGRSFDGALEIVKTTFTFDQLVAQREYPEDRAAFYVYAGCVTADLITRYGMNKVMELARALAERTPIERAVRDIFECSYEALALTVERDLQKRRKKGKSI